MISTAEMQLRVIRNPNLVIRRMHTSLVWHQHVQDRSQSAAAARIRGMMGMIQAITSKLIMSSL